MADAQEAWDNWNGFAEGNMRGHNRFREPVSDDDDRRNEQEPGELAWSGKAHWAASHSEQ